MDFIKAKDHACGGFVRSARLDFPEIKSKVEWVSRKKWLSRRLPVAFCCKLDFEIHCIPPMHRHTPHIICRDNYCEDAAKENGVKIGTDAGASTLSKAILLSPKDHAYGGFVRSASLDFPEIKSKAAVHGAFRVLEPPQTWLEVAQWLWWLQLALKVWNNQDKLIEPEKAKLPNFGQPWFDGLQASNNQTNFKNGFRESKTCESVRMEDLRYFACKWAMVARLVLARGKKMPWIPLGWEVSREEVWVSIDHAFEARGSNECPIVDVHAKTI
ncbi:hypothetical protein CRG98_034389 [Punica granatum]|uniref:Uncharacterized protein n=1 Tax=Punica granatum TaxID=22663 RepID=A0A2I0IMH3_PUNGR|nr:hypothetical protein CRG98_034389 [Punica granatum]